MCPGNQSSRGGYGMHGAMAPRGHRGDSLMPANRPDHVVAYFHKTPQVTDEIKRLAQAVVVDARFLGEYPEPPQQMGLSDKEEEGEIHSKKQGILVDEGILRALLAEATTTDSKNHILRLLKGKGPVQQPVTVRQVKQTHADKGKGKVQETEHNGLPVTQRQSAVANTAPKDPKTASQVRFKVKHPVGLTPGSQSTISVGLSTGSLVIREKPDSPPRSMDLEPVRKQLFSGPDPEADKGNGPPLIQAQYQAVTEHEESQMRDLIRGLPSIHTSPNSVLIPTDTESPPPQQAQQPQPAPQSLLPSPQPSPSVRRSTRTHRAPTLYAGLIPTPKKPRSKTDDSKKAVAAGVKEAGIVSKLSEEEIRAKPLTDEKIAAIDVVCGTKEVAESEASGTNNETEDFGTEQAPQVPTRLSWADMVEQEEDEVRARVEENLQDSVINMDEDEGLNVEDFGEYDMELNEDYIVDEEYEDGYHEGALEGEEEEEVEGEEDGALTATTEVPPDTAN